MKQEVTEGYLAHCFLLSLITQSWIDFHLSPNQGTPWEREKRKWILFMKEPEPGTVWEPFPVCGQEPSMVSSSCLFPQLYSVFCEWMNEVNPPKSRSSYTSACVLVSSIFKVLCIVSGYLKQYIMLSFLIFLHILKERKIYTKDPAHKICSISLIHTDGY